MGDLTQEGASSMPSTAPRARRQRFEDQSEVALHKGTLWKLDSNGNPKDAAHWLKRDMWVAANGSLCYFSQKENKRLVLLDAGHVSGAQITKFEGGAMPHAFQIKQEQDDEANDVAVFAC